MVTCQEQVGREEHRSALSVHGDRAVAGTRGGQGRDSLAPVTDSSTPSLSEINDLEDCYKQSGEQSLGRARSDLIARWGQGLRDRETALRLAFLDWYACSEPTWLTGLPELGSDGEDQSRFPELFGILVDQHADQEVRFVLGWMAKTFPYCCGAGTDAEWEATGAGLWEEYESKPPLGSGVFADRGAYGHYFAHILAVRGKQH